MNKAENKKTRKRIIVVLLIILALPFVVAVFVKKKVVVARSVEIEKSTKQVYDFLRYNKNQVYFSAWAEIDANAKRTYTDNDGQVGAIYSWDSENEDLGAGEQEITKLIENERVEFELRFSRPFEAVNVAYFDISESASNFSKVTWGFEAEFTYPLNIMVLFLDFEGPVGVNFERGLDNLKKLLESS